MSETFSYNDYMPFLAGFELTDEHKRAVIDALWVMMSGLVDAEEFAPVAERVPCGQLSEKTRQRPTGLRDQVQWKPINTTHEFALASGLSAPPGKESP